MGVTKKTKLLFKSIFWIQTTFFFTRQIWKLSPLIGQLLILSPQTFLKLRDRSKSYDNSHNIDFRSSNFI